jgi:hypothetical protein
MQRFQFCLSKPSSMLAFLLVAVPVAFAAAHPAAPPSIATIGQAQPQLAAADLSGKGLAQHPFLYCGEWQNRSIEDQNIYVVRGGKIVWTYTNPLRGELDDCWMLRDGNILFARQFGASEITPRKKIVWNYDAPPHTEIHSVQPIGINRVLLMQNGNPAKLMLLDKRTNKVVKQLILQTRSQNTHAQFRHVRMTSKGTLLAPHLDLGKVVEYTWSGKKLWSVDAPSAWAAVRLKNGDTLISGNQHGYVREVDPEGKIVWEINRNDLPGITLYTVQEVDRLANGDTVICNWPGELPLSEWPSAVQVIEVTPDKKVVWALHDYRALGPASTIQLLDQPGNPEKPGDLER